MGRGKGIGWLATFHYLETAFGKEGIEKVKAVLSQQDHEELFGRKILVSSWYDSQSYMNFMLAADKILGRGDQQLIREAAYACARDNFKGVYKFFISLTSPKFVLNNSHNVWRQYYDSGRVKVQWRGEKHATLQLTEFPDIPLYHDIDNGPTLEEVIRISGGQNVRVTHPKCMARGDPACITEVKWE